MTYWACLEGDSASVSFFEAAFAVYEVVIALVEVLLQSEGLSIWFKAASVHLKGAAIWLMYGCPKDCHLLQQGFEVSILFCGLFCLASYLFENVFSWPI